MVNMVDTLVNMVKQGEPVCFVTESPLVFDIICETWHQIIKIVLYVAVKPTLPRKNVIFALTLRKYFQLFLYSLRGFSLCDKVVRAELPGKERIFIQQKDENLKTACKNFGLDTPVWKDQTIQKFCFRRIFPVNVFPRGF